MYRRPGFDDESAAAAASADTRAVLDVGTGAAASALSMGIGWMLKRSAAANALNEDRNPCIAGTRRGDGRTGSRMASERDPLASVPGTQGITGSDTSRTLPWISTTDRYARFRNGLELGTHDILSEATVSTRGSQGHDIALVATYRSILSETSSR